jgi:hypothetical protein
MHLRLFPLAAASRHPRHRHRLNIAPELPTKLTNTFTFRALSSSAKVFDLHFVISGPHSSHEIGIEEWKPGWTTIIWYVDSLSFFYHPSGLSKRH